MRILLSLFLLLSAANTAFATEYKAKLAKGEVTVPLMDGTKLFKEEPETHTSHYDFILVDKASQKPKLRLDVTITTLDKGVPQNKGQAYEAMAELIQSTKLDIPKDRVKVAVLADKNKDFMIYWAPYYRLSTQQPEAPMLIYKPTLLVDRSNSVAVIVQMTGFLIFKEATTQDLQIAEKLMDQMMVPIAARAELRLVSGK